MKRIKRSGIFLICGIFCGLAVMAGLFCFFLYAEKYAVSQALRIWGFRTEHTEEAAEEFWEFMSLSEEELALYEEKGKEVFEEAGYSSSGIGFLMQKLRESLFVLGGVCLFFFLLGIFLIRLCMKRERALRTEAKAALFHAEEEKSILRAELSALYERTEIYQANLYHQMKTALTQMQLLLNRMQEQAAREGKEELLSGMHKLEPSIGQMARLLTLLLREHQVSQGKIKYAFTEYFLPDILTEAVEELLEAALEKQNKIEMFCEEEVFIACDHMWLKQSFVTILENAIEHAEEGGVLQVRMIKKREGIAVSVFSPGARLPEEKLYHVFERFYSGGKENGHYGIGMHMAQMVIGQHHGKIGIENTEAPTGVLVSILLPLFSTSASIGSSEEKEHLF